MFTDNISRNTYVFSRSVTLQYTGTGFMSLNKILSISSSSVLIPSTEKKCPQSDWFIFE